MTSVCACGGRKARSSIVCATCAQAEKDRKQMRICKGCGITFKRKTSTSNDGLYHSAQCFYAYWSELKATKDQERARLRQPKTCAVCGQGISARRKYCSRDCSSKVYGSRKAAPKPRTLVTRQCTICRHTFQVTTQWGSPPSICSDTCRRIAKQHARRKGRATEAHRRHKRIEKSARRARERQTKREPLDPIMVFQRDGWRCQLCGVKTPQVLRGKMVPNAPELDHIVPLALNGPHTYTNTQCTCRSCNSRKGATALGQLRLAV